MPAPQIVVIILSFNSEDAIARVLKPCKTFADRILVVDSGSTDRTVEIAKEFGCETANYPFDNYSASRNWAQEHANVSETDWILHLDSDEVLGEKLIAEIKRVTQENNDKFEGFLFKKRFYFMGQPIRWGNINPSWHLRLYRAGKGYCEHRLYDQHYVVPGETARLKGLLHDLQLTSVERWTQSHNRWSDAEAHEIYKHFVEVNRAKKESSDGQLEANLRGDSREQKRWLKNKLYYRAPALLRPFIFFFYSYFIRLGFLDGKVGLIYHVLQSFWFRFLVDAKLVEKDLQKEGKTGVNTLAK